jgi:hypothetical protein
VPKTQPEVNPAPGAGVVVHLGAADLAVAVPELGAPRLFIKPAFRQVLRWFQTSGEFVANFMPPSYLVVGLLQRRFVYSLTGPTGSGKTTIALLIAYCVAFGISIAGRKVKRGRVLFFAGENPDDVRMRWVLLCNAMEVDPDEVDVVFAPGARDLSTAEVQKRLKEYTTEYGPFALVIVDTSASFYSGNDENDAVQLGNHARMLRTFVEFPGGPTILVTCHPIKNPNMDNLLPRGAGAFLAEVDGNLVCLHQRGNPLVEITWHGKWRGPDFAPFNFKIQPGTTDKLRDTDGNKIWTVSAAFASEADVSTAEGVRHTRENELIVAMLGRPHSSLTELAAQLGWFYQTGEPNKAAAYRVMQKLVTAKLVAMRRDRWDLTPAGKAEAERLKAEAEQHAPAQGELYPEDEEI